ncbi:hypothetical protein FRB94_008876 [Tulasnella sp. JGI-2019a]|nr:hypothetical protein FRB93_004378 [Tulasnella sp. JGI-2019a]KAG8995680.1 hypothetical protein FRB94_008876 [Tulasnella sp. JGI-2019a]KAG9028150.1 hypothetical protein FRB95_006799 [Tulasnella sp. JGI-2019a]
MDSFLNTPTSASPFSLFTPPSSTSDTFGFLFAQVQPRRGSLPTSSASSSQSTSSPGTPSIPHTPPRKLSLNDTISSGSTLASWPSRAKQIIMTFPRRKSAST